MTKGATKKRPAPLMFRVSHEERAAIEKAAAGLSMNAYLRSVVFDKAVRRNKARGAEPIKDHKLLGQALGRLGAWDVASNLDELTKACQTGSLPVSEETESALLNACANIQEMKLMLMRALAVRTDGGAQ